MNYRNGPTLGRQPCSGQAAGRRARDPGKEPAGQAFLVLQHEALVGRMAEQFFHARAHINVLAPRQSTAAGAGLIQRLVLFLTASDPVVVVEAQPLLDLVQHTKNQHGEKRGETAYLP